MATQPFPVQLPIAPQIPAVPEPPVIKTWPDLHKAFASNIIYLRKLTQFLSTLLGQYAADINLAFGAAQTVVSKAVTLPNAATTKIGNVALGNLIALAQGDFVSMAAQGVITPSQSFNVVVKGNPSGVQISGLPNATVTSDGSGNFHFADSGTVPAGMVGDTSFDFYVVNATGGGMSLTSANLGVAQQGSL